MRLLSRIKANDTEAKHQINQYLIPSCKIFSSIAPISYVPIIPFPAGPSSPTLSVLPCETGKCKRNLSPIMRGFSAARKEEKKSQIGSTRTSRRGIKGITENIRSYCASQFLCQNHDASFCNNGFQVGGSGFGTCLERRL